MNSTMLLDKVLTEPEYIKVISDDDLRELCVEIDELDESDIRLERAATLFNEECDRRAKLEYDRIEREAEAILEGETYR